MTTTDLIKLLNDNEYGAISHKPRNISLTINGKYMPDPSITLSSTGDGIAGPEIDLDIVGEFFEEQQSDDAVNKDLAEYEKDLNELKEQILKEGNTLLTKRDLLERFCKIDKEYNGRSWSLLQILANINILIGQEPCEDCISRQAAIDIASGYCHPSNIAKELAKLPSVQPIYNTSEWCHDCKEYDQDKHCCSRFNRVIRNAVKEIKKPKMGHWIEYTRVLIPEPINSWKQAWYCSECGYGNQECEEGSARPEWKCCPCCGARMIEPQESEDKE